MGPNERKAVLDRWMSRSSPAEDDRMERAERMVRAAIDAHPAFVDYRGSIKVYPKGSYANRTNVRADSDVDVVVENQDLYYYEYFPRSDAPTPDPNAIPYRGRWDDEDDWRSEVLAALQNAYGPAHVDTSGKVAITIDEVPGSRPSTDVVPSFEFRRFDSPDRRAPHVGSRVFSTDGKAIDNFPEQQRVNGIAKDGCTRGRYKKYVRALKSAENFLADDGQIEGLPSYFMECLVWNVPDSIINRGLELADGFHAVLGYLLVNLHADDFDSEKWEEPNGLKWLFRGEKKWTPEDGLFLAFRTLKHLGYV
ncbi:hypothetical protein EDF28_0811 [Curtobacterium sp. PhB137]|uniref:nucleotidyltransferase domain-containing protein n=1 Tax=Curtobacterium sp. PhB137 TaxID=2485182 RepID=UPI000F50A69A|nr:nucleotidyltransferase [Curtobacterium sp. PhB137]RPE84869.1 hypothetical protein EDF28_0811 [Curtobacterium sp. PhB137]